MKRLLTAIAATTAIGGFIVLASHMVTAEPAIPKKVAALPGRFIHS